jgi:hypothetical protein
MQQHAGLATSSCTTACIGLTQFAGCPSVLVNSYSCFFRHWLPAAVCLHSHRQHCWWLQHCLK